MQNLSPGAYFITGTGTGVGKTYFTGRLAGSLAQRGYSVITQKWIQTGELSPVDGDVGEHDRLSGLSYPDATLNDRCPFCFEYPASPHLAAKLEHCHVDTDRIKRSFLSLSADYDIVLVEGAGGPLVPLTESVLTIDLVAQLGLPCIVVVSNRLGAIHDTLATVESIQSRNVDVLGLVFNHYLDTPQEIRQDNQSTILKLTGVANLGVLELE
jgi:dethiobiotin synthetase